MTSPILFTSTSTKSNNYICQAINSYGKTSSQLFLQIQVPARILLTTSNRTVKINEQLNISCLAEGDNQLELFIKHSLLKKLNTIEYQFKNQKQLSIIIDHIKMSDSGLYECYAKNNYSFDRSIFEIIVQKSKVFGFSFFV